MFSAPPFCLLPSPTPFRFQDFSVSAFQRFTLPLSCVLCISWCPSGKSRASGQQFRTERAVAKAAGRGLMAGKLEKSKLRSQQGELPSGAETVEVEG
jgi:hypothetical protein